MSLKSLKTKITAMKKSQTVTRAMEAVSAAKMRKAQQQALRGRAYARASAQVLSRISGSRELQQHPLARRSALPAGRQVYIVITSDKGLAGALNSGVLKAALRDMAHNGLSKGQVSIIAVGRKANDFFASRGYTIEAFHLNNAELGGVLVRTLVDEAAQRFAAEEVDAVKIVYQNFVSTFEQRPTLRTVLPLSLNSLQEVVADIVPQKGAYADVGKDAQPTTYTLEPSEGELMEQILPMLASVIVYHALLEGLASEHSARMVAMKGATDKAGELQEKLTLQFNKARQAAITREVSEITGGMEAMAN